MKIPLALVKDVTMLVLETHHCDGFKHPPGQLGEACGQYARAWWVRAIERGIDGDWDVSGSVAWATRWGKYLGEFYSTQKGV